MDLTQKELVKELRQMGAGISQSHYSKIENGTKNPSITVAKVMACFFNTTIDKLI